MGPESFAVLLGKDNNPGAKSYAETSHSLVTHTPVGKEGTNLPTWCAGEVLAKQFPTLKLLTH